MFSITKTTSWWAPLLLLLPACGSQQLETDQFHRSLAGFVLPFQITWKFVISAQEGFPADRQPTEAEYEGVRVATIDWFTEEIPMFYAASEDFSFREIDCDLDNTVYTPDAVDPAWVHEARYNCEVIWDADAIEDTPNVVKFLLDMNADYLLANFVDPHLREANPQNPRNIFQFSRRVGYVTNDFGTRGPAPVSGESTAPGSPAPTTPVAATPVPSPPAPSPAPTTQGPTTALPQKKIAPPAKCGSLASTNDRGGAASDAKGCTSRTPDGDVDKGGRRKRRLKGSNY